MEMDGPVEEQEYVCHQRLRLSSLAKEVLMQQAETQGMAGREQMVALEK